MATSVRVVGARQLKTLAKDLRQQADGKERRKTLSRELRAAVNTVVPHLRAAIHSIPSKGHGPRRGRKGTLRSEMSRAVTSQVRTTGKNLGASVYMSPRKMPDKAKSLPAYFEQEPGYTSLRHPVYGRWLRGQAAQKVPPRGYFTRTVQPLEREVREIAQKAIDQTVKDLES